MGFGFLARFNLLKAYLSRIHREGFLIQPEAGQPLADFSRSRGDAEFYATLKICLIILCEAFASLRLPMLKMRDKFCESRLKPLACKVFFGLAEKEMPSHMNNVLKYLFRFYSVIVLYQKHL